jgi:dehydrogenase/reductase SDR family member 7B
MKDKVIIITGGSSGIGKAMAEAFGERDSKILITGRNSEELNKTVAELKEKNIDIHGFQADVSVEQDNRRMAEEAIKKFGHYYARVV